MSGLSLIRFSEKEIILTTEEAKVIYKFFFQKNETIQELAKSNEELRVIEIALAQSLLVMALDRSYDMGYVSILFDSLTNKKKTLQSADKIIKKFAKKAFKHWFKNATEDDLWEKAEVYETVRTFVVRNFETLVGKIVINNIDIGYDLKK